MVLSPWLPAGRLFDFHVLDMVELGIEKYVGLSDFKVTAALSVFIQWGMYTVYFLLLFPGSSALIRDASLGAEPKPLQCSPGDPTREKSYMLF